MRLRGERHPLHVSDMIDGTMPLIEGDCGQKNTCCRPMEEVMIHKIAFVVGYAVIQVLSNPALVAAADFGTAEDA
jgi:hypothetical protein